MTGKEIKQMIFDAGLRLWQVAEGFGVAESTFSKKLRHDFTEEEVTRVKSIIKDLTKEKTPANRG